MEISIPCLPGWKTLMAFPFSEQPLEIELKLTQIHFYNLTVCTCRTFLNCAFWSSSLLFVLFIRLNHTHTLPLPPSTVSNLWRVPVLYYYPLQSSSGQLGDVQTSALTCFCYLILAPLSLLPLSLVKPLCCLNSEWELSRKAPKHAARASASRLQSRLKRAGIKASNSRVAVFPLAERNSFQCDCICVCLHEYLWRLVFIWLTQ